ncbi:MAG: dihydrofolate reductase [Chlamydiales bacterium]|nr:dihydrofolate reductase [Chlamydiales bacterium]
MTLRAIVACDMHGGIGFKGGIPWNVPGDKFFFRQQTLHKTMIMGHKTYLSMPQRAFENRMSIVLTKREITSIPPHIFFVHDAATSIQLAKQKDREEVFVIGGSEIFNLFFSQRMIDDLLLSWIPGTYPCDTHFPLHWLETATSKKHLFDGEGFTVYRYTFRGKNENYTH